MSSISELDPEINGFVEYIEIEQERDNLCLYLHVFLPYLNTSVPSILHRVTEFLLNIPGVRHVVCSIIRVACTILEFKKIDKQAWVNVHFREAMQQENFLVACRLVDIGEKIDFQVDSAADRKKKRSLCDFAIVKGFENAAIILLNSEAKDGENALDVLARRVQNYCDGTLLFDPDVFGCIVLYLTDLIIERKIEVLNLKSQELQFLFDLAWRVGWWNVVEKLLESREKEIENQNALTFFMDEYLERASLYTDLEKLQEDTDAIIKYVSSRILEGEPLLGIERKGMQWLFNWSWNNKRSDIVMRFLQAGKTLTGFNSDLLTCDIKMPKQIKVPETLAKCLTVLNEPLGGLALREELLLQLMDVASSSSAPHALLVGDPGVGKTSLVQSFQQKLLEKGGNFEHPFTGRKILELDLLGLSSIGELQGFLRKNSSSCILFIDNIDLVWPDNPQHAENIQFILNEIISDIPVVMTCSESTKRNFQKASISKKFTVVHINQPDQEEAFALCREAVKRVEIFQDIKISDHVLLDAIQLCRQYLPNLPLIDTVINFCDRAAISALKNFSQMQQDAKQLSVCFDQQKLLIAMKEWRLDLEQLDEIEEKEKVLREEIEQLQKLNKEGVKFELTVDDIRAKISVEIGIPLHTLTRDRKEELRKAEEILAKSVVGQDYALKIVANAMRLYENGLGSLDKPIGSFLFTGTSGVGKTALAKATAEVFFGDPNAMIVIPMGEYGQEHNVSNLTGSPPGYKGSEKEGYLTLQIRERPHQVILFDEIEKAHPSFFKLLMNICDQGFYKDTQSGEKVDCSHLIVILTSNLGSPIIWDMQKSLEEGTSLKERVRKLTEAVSPSLESFFPPEFLARITTVPFFPLTDTNILKKIVEGHLEKEQKFLEKNGLKITWDRSVVDYLVEKGKDPKRGIRPIIMSLLKNESLF